MNDHAKRSILFHGLLSFAVTSALALGAVATMTVRGLASYEPSPAISAPYFLVLFFMATLALLFALRITKSGAIFAILFTVAMVSGAWFLADIFLPGSLALIVGSAVILARFRWKKVLILNATMAIGIAGISASVATDLSLNAVLVILTVLAFYDIVAVYATKHMVTMFRELAARGSVFAFVLTPLEPKALLGPVPEAGERALFLGTGDVALPVMLAVTAAGGGLARGIGVAFGAMAGFCLMFYLFHRQGRRRPMPALPPIALGSVLGYLLSLLLPLA
jgi:presenilin-like A22 family membrane protease